MGRVPIGGIRSLIEDALATAGLPRADAAVCARLMGEADLTPTQGWSLPALRRTWNLRKDAAAPWWAEHSKEAYNTGLDQLARALKNWADSRNGERMGRRVGFPRFKSRRMTR